MIRVLTDDLGYREIERLAQFLIKCSTDHKYYDNINLWIELGYEVIDLGYSVHYDEGFMRNELGITLYESDFE